MRVAPLFSCAVLLAAGCATPTAATAPVGPLVVLGVLDAGGGAFLGSGACGACHPAAYSRWRATGHAQEYAGLLPADRRNPACLRCHVTGYGERYGYRAGGGSADLASVGCEACHGPGSDHGHSAHPELVPTLTGGECPPCEINRVCRLCHTTERSPGFEFDRDVPRVSCQP